MDIPLFGICLLTFAGLYLGLTVFLLWTLVITIFVIMAWMAVRWRSVSENYPHGLGDTLTLVVLVAITWVLFVILGPKPVPFIGSGLTYGAADWSTVTSVVIMFVFVILILMSILIPYLQGRAQLGGGGGGGDLGGGKTPVGVGAG